MVLIQFPNNAMLEETANLLHGIKKKKLAHHPPSMNT